MEDTESKNESVSSDTLLSEDSQELNESNTVEEASTSEESASLASLHDQLAEDLREDPSLKDLKDINALAKSYISAQRMLGSSIRIPGEDASDEAKAEFYNKIMNVPGVLRAPTEESKADFFNQLGRPESPDGYKIEADMEVFDKDKLAEFAKVAHEAGLTNDQMNALAKYEESRTKAAMENYNQSKADSLNKLKEIWGTDYDNRLNVARAVINQYSGKYPDEIKSLVNSEAGNNPAFLAMLAELGKTFVEEGSIKPNGTRTAFGDTPEEARAKIQEIQENLSHPYHDKEHPEHEAAVQSVRKLYRAASPE